MNGKFCDSSTAKNVGAVVDSLLYKDSWRAVKFVSDKLVITATRKRYGKSGWTSRDQRCDIALTIGAPNYEARKFIRACKKSGEPFPVKKIQLKARPVRKDNG